MRKSIIGIGIVIVILAILALSIPGIYNGLVQSEENVNKKWADVEGAYQRRADLIPNLVNTVKGYAKHEHETFIEVVEQRANATKPQFNIDPAKLDEATLANFQQAQDELKSALGRLLVVVENYPELKANQNFLELQAQLEGTENRINVERRNFNEAVQQFNSKLRKFPTNFIGKLFGFSAKPYFKSQPGSQEVPKVEF